MIEIYAGPLHEAEVDAILRPVSSELAAVTGAGRDVDLRIGAAIHDRLRAASPLPVGGALATPGGELAVPFLIHVAVQSADEPVTEAGVARGLLNGLRRAMELEVESLVLPPLGTGAGNLDAEASAGIMLPILLAHLARETFPSRVILAVAPGYEHEVFRVALDRELDS